MSAPTTVHIDAAALAAIDAHARAEQPRECCGLLVGTSVEASRLLRVDRAAPTRNAADEPTRRYLIDPADHFRLLRELRHAGDAARAIIGVYHSHPASRPEPSPTDLAEALPNFLYLIASPDMGRHSRAWWLVDGNFLEIPLVHSS